MDSDGVGYGGPGDDYLFTEAGTTGSGDTALFGDAGDDRFSVTSRTPGLQVYGNGGRDQVIVDGVVAGVRGRTRGRHPVGGRRREQHGHDRGRCGDDRISAVSGSAETIACGPGSDTILVDLAGSWSQGCETIQVRTDGTSANDRLIGTFCTDVMDAGSGDDLIAGRAGDDQFYGGPGNDVLYGGPGDDVLLGDRGRDRVRGGDGDDVMVVDQDNGKDAVTCGAGSDTVEATALEVIAADCEIVKLRMILARSGELGSR